MSNIMILALPLTDKFEFSAHFGGASYVGLVQVDPATSQIVKTWSEKPEEPEPCGWVDWLAAKGVRCFFAGGMGQGAQERMRAAGIEVVVGVPNAEPELLVQAWLAGTLSCGANACEGGHHVHGDHHHQNHHHDHGHEHHSGGCHCGH